MTKASRPGQDSRAAASGSHRPAFRLNRLESPTPSSAHATATMRANRSRNTGPELRIRRLLHAAGLRFRVSHPVYPDVGRRIVIDIAFTKMMLAVFVDGCFWHSCPRHSSSPKSNVAYWAAKLERNRERDRSDTKRLEAAGWNVMRVWEHEAPDEAAKRIAVASGS
jgi:DNA mismatch endonuclease, patch repair protein